MENNNNLSRITIDLPAKLQIKLKALAALNNKSMRAIVIESIELQLQKLEMQTTGIFFKKDV